MLNILWQRAFERIFNLTSPLFGGATKISYNFFSKIKKWSKKKEKEKENEFKSTSIWRGWFGPHAIAALHLIGLGIGSTPRAK